MKNIFRNSLQRIKNKHGSMLAMSYILIITFTMLASTFVVMSINQSRWVERERLEAQVFQIAEAGIDRALYNLRRDFVNDSSSPSWSDSDIDGMAIGPNTGAFYTVPYISTSLNGGAYTVELKNVIGNVDAVWVKSTGTLNGVSQTIQVYAKIYNVSPWDNAIFAGTGAAGAMVNGNVKIAGNVHILGTGLSPTDYAVDLGGTAELIGNNYSGLEAGLLAKVPALPTISFGGETVQSLGAELRVKRGKVGLSGSSSAGEANVAGNSVKETIAGSYVTNGYGGNQGTNNVNSDNGWSNGYDLGDAVTFPSLNDPYNGYAHYKDYLKANALVLDTVAQKNVMASLKPNSSFSYSNANGSISMDGNGNLTISGIVYVDGGTIGMAKSGSDTTITYTGTGSLFSTGDMQIDVNLVTAGNNSFPNNIIGFMTPGSIGFNVANINVMGLFYGETSIVSQKQTDVMGTFVSNLFNMGTNVPSIFQVPEVVNHLPPGLIGTSGFYVMRIVAWQKL